MSIQYLLTFKLKFINQYLVCLPWRLCRPGSDFSWMTPGAGFCIMGTSAILVVRLALNLLLFVVALLFFQAVIQFIPNMLDQIEIGRFCRPRQNVHVMIVKMIDFCSGCIGSSFILMENKPRISIQKRKHIQVHYLVDVCIGSEIALDYMEGGFGIECDSTHPISLHFHLHVYSFLR